ncbi:MAG: hypothetical protein WCG20_03400 [bacterium]
MSHTQIPILLYPGGRLGKDFKNLLDEAKIDYAMQMVEKDEDPELIAPTHAYSLKKIGDVKSYVAFILQTRDHAEA